MHTTDYINDHVKMRTTITYNCMSLCFLYWQMFYAGLVNLRVKRRKASLRVKNDGSLCVA